MVDYKAEDLVRLIRQRYPLNRPNGYQAYVVLEQVPNGTGAYQGRWIDAAVFSLWPSKGLTRAAFEVKVSRSDFTRELQNPTKNEWALGSFHEFWFVAPSNVIQLEELPPNVGWMCPHGDKLVIKRNAVRNPSPKLDDYLLAAFMRAAAKEIDRTSCVTADEVLEKSEKYRRAKVYQDAIIRFLNQRGAFNWLDPSTPDDVVKWLDEATMDKQLKQDREHLLKIAGCFQSEIIHLLNLFLVLAHKGLLARDELGKYIVSAYGGRDEDALESLKERARNPKALESQQLYAELVELIVNWGKEQNG